MLSQRDVALSANHVPTDALRFNNYDLSQHTSKTHQKSQPHNKTNSEVKSRGTGE
jgi:hypothetical protein